MSGTLYGVGVGPGDPDLLTLKAARVLRSVPVIAYPAPLQGEGMARGVAAPHLPGGQEEIVLRMAFDPAQPPPDDVYDEGARMIAGRLAAGRDVAFLCEGDPLFFGSFIHLLDRLRGACRVVVVPGVSSPMACAAVLAEPLAERDEALAVVPATRPEAEIEALLRRSQAAVVMKVGRHLPKVRRVLDRLGLAGRARLVARAGFADQRVMTLDEAAEAGAPYFSMILVRRAALPVPAAAEEVRGEAPREVAVVVLSSAAEGVARRIARTLPGARVHGLAGRAGEADAWFAAAADHLRRLYAEGTAIVGVCAAGILVRVLAPVLGDKRREPPVIAVAADGSAVVPLLGGHRGANALARRVGEALGIPAAITTAGDTAMGLALDEPPPGWRVADGGAAKAVAAALLAGAPVGLEVEAGDASRLREAIPAAAGAAAASVVVTHRTVEARADRLVLHPPVLALGVGCERGADPGELAALALEALAGQGLSPRAVACVASLELKADEPAVHALAARLGVPARFFPADVLEALTPRLANPSDAVFRAVGCHGVAEAAALAAAGAEGALLVPKVRSARATCAVALAPSGIDALAVGRARGSLAVVGIGPGHASWRTPEASRAVAEAEELVGYALYLDLLGEAAAGKPRFDSPLGAEEDRVRLALDRAAEGRRVALVCSGDAGIYALATLVFELVDRESRPEWDRLAITVVPGVSALQAAAARVGAPINHDFCAISLSDLLTPWEAIERRLRAAAEGDFVVALYNPVSRRRRDQLLRARELLLAGRPAGTPVVLARNLGREGETIEVSTLAELHPDKVDMLTVVLVGGSETRVSRQGRVYTPRGYGSKFSRRPPQER